MRQELLEDLEGHVNDQPLGAEFRADATDSLAEPLDLRNAHKGHDLM